MPSQENWTNRQNVSSPFPPHTPTPLTHPLHTQEGTGTHNIMGVIVGGAAASQEARLQICLKQAHFVSWERWSRREANKYLST